MKITIKAARVNAGLTLREAAKALGISDCTLSSYENGKTAPKWKMLERMAELYHAPIECLKQEVKF